MLISMGRDCDVDDYAKLAKKIFGKRGYIAICLFMAFLAFGAMTACKSHPADDTIAANKSQLPPYHLLPLSFSISQTR
jgi:hypothetical protein